MIENVLKLISTETSDGVFHIIVNAEDVARASGFGDIEALRKRLPTELRTAELHPVDEHPYSKLVQQYYNGDTIALDKIPRDQTGTDFQKRVWRAIGAVPYGQTISYKQLADQSGNTTAIRAAGTICGLNRLILLVPCHRILKTDGSIGSYLYGSTIKRSLLAREKSAHI